jgi:5,6-dimethylbenzimidazole synthase
MEFEKLVKERRSVRTFEKAAVSESQLAGILEAGRWAPSPLNLQPWQFILVDDPQIKARVRSASEEAREEVKAQDGPSWAAKYQMDFLTEAPILLVVVVDPSKGGLGGYFGQQYGAMQGASACVQNILLACADMGLGALWFTFFRPEKLRPVLNIPDNLEIAGIIPIGTPGGDTKAPPRKEPKIHKNGYTESSKSEKP